MAKQVILAHPFERISGNVTRAKQKLVYAENDNPAWQAPEGKQYARNFKPQMNLRYSAKTGKTSYRIQTKAAVDNTAAGRLCMALFGGALAVVNAVKHNPTLLANAYEEYAKVRDSYKSLDSFLTLNCRQMLKTKSYKLTIGNFQVNNPWVAGGSSAYDVTISDEVWQKFAEYLCPVVFLMNGKKYAVEDGFNGDVIRRYSEFTMSSGGDLLYNGENIYDYTGSKMYDTDSFKNGKSYTTTPPNA